MKRIQIIDLVRTLSIFLVVGMHLFDMKSEYNGADFFSLQEWCLAFSNGSYGVSIFFLVSGFLITGLIMDGKPDAARVDLKSFYARRVARIFPLWFLVLLIGWTLVEFWAPPTWEFANLFKRPGFPYDSGFWMSFPTLLFNWLLSFRLNFRGLFPGIYWAVMWSLSIEEQFYLVFPYTLRKLKRRGPILAFLAAVIAGGLAYRIALTLLGYRNYYYTVVTSFGSFDQIAMGALLYFLSQKWKKELSKKRGQCLALLGLGAAIMATAYVNMPLGSPTYLNSGVVLGPFFVSAGCFLFLLGGLHLDFFERGLWRWISIPGQLSYGCYLWHSLVLFLLWPVLGPMRPLPAFALTFAAVVLFAYFSYRWVEMPANRRIRRFFGAEKNMSLSVPGLK